MPMILKTLGNHPDLGSFQADLLDDGTARIGVDPDVEYTPERIYELIEALKQVNDQINQEAAPCN